MLTTLTTIEKEKAFYSEKRTTVSLRSSEHAFSLNQGEPKGSTLNTKKSPTLQAISTQMAISWDLEPKTAAAVEV